MAGGIASDCIVIGRDVYDTIMTANLSEPFEEIIIIVSPGSPSPDSQTIATNRLSINESP